MDKKSVDISELKAQKVVANYLFQSDYYQIKNWFFDFEKEDQVSKGYNDCLCLVLVRSGRFCFELSEEKYDIYTGHAIIDKPNYEYKLRPSTGQCTIFNFAEEFYQNSIEDLNLKNAFFFGNNNLLSLLVKTNPEIDYLHYQILKQAPAVAKLQMDALVLELFEFVSGSHY